MSKIILSFIISAVLLTGCGDKESTDKTDVSTETRELPTNIERDHRIKTGEYMVNISDESGNVKADGKVRIADIDTVKGSPGERKVKLSYDLDNIQGTISKNLPKQGILEGSLDSAQQFGYFKAPEDSLKLNFINISDTITGTWYVGDKSSGKFVGIYIGQR